TMKDAHKLVKALKITDAAKSQDEAIDSVLKFVKGQGDKTDNLSALTKALSPENRQVLEMHMLARLFSKSLFEEADMRVFDSKDFFKRLNQLQEGKDGIFKSPAAQEFINLAKGFNRLFINDALLARSIKPATSEKIGSSIATSIEGAVKYQLIKEAFSHLVRLAPYIPMATGFNEKVAGAALRYHLKSALSKSHSVEQFKTHLNAVVQKQPFDNKTKQLIREFLKGFDDDPPPSPPSGGDGGPAGPTPTPPKGDIEGTNPKGNEPQNPKTDTTKGEGEGDTSPKGNIEDLDAAIDTMQGTLPTKSNLQGDLSPQEIKTHIEQWDLNNPKATDRLLIGKVDGQELEQLAQEFNFKGNYALARQIDAQHVAHALNRHGDLSVETSRNQIPITLEDISNYPNIVKSADVREVEGNNIVYKKQINGHYVVVEEALTKKNKINFVTMWKSKGNLTTLPTPSSTGHDLDRTLSESYKGGDSTTSPLSADLSPQEIKQAVKKWDLTNPKPTDSLDFALVKDPELRELQEVFNTDKLIRQIRSAEVKDTLDKGFSLKEVLDYTSHLPTAQRNILGDELHYTKPLESGKTLNIVETYKAPKTLRFSRMDVVEDRGVATAQRQIDNPPPPKGDNPPPKGDEPQNPTSGLEQAWLETFGLKSVDEPFIPKFSPEVAKALEPVLKGEQIQLTQGSLIKLEKREREEFLPLIRPTLEEPNAIVKQADGALIFVKDFGTTKFFASVARNDSKEWVVTSNAPKTLNNLLNKVKEGGEVLISDLPGLPIIARPHDIAALRNGANQANNTTTPLKTEALNTKKTPKLDQFEKERLQKLLERLKKNSGDFGNVAHYLQEWVAGRGYQKETLDNLIDYLIARDGFTYAYDDYMKAIYPQGRDNHELRRELYFIESYRPYLISELKRIREEFTKSYKMGMPGEYAASVEWQGVERRKENFKNLKRIHQELKRLTTHKRALQEAILNPQAPKPTFSILDMEASMPPLEARELAIYKKLINPSFKLDALYRDLYYKRNREFYDKLLRKIEPLKRELEALKIEPNPEFGENFAEYAGKGAEAVKKLLQEKRGQVSGAFYRPDLGESGGYIDLVWGSVKNKEGKIEGHGLSKIVEKHLEDFSPFEGNTPLEKLGNGLEEIIRNGDIVKRQGRTEAYNIEHNGFIVGINKGYDKKGDNYWIVTAFDRATPISEKTPKTARAKDLTKGADNLPLNSKPRSTTTPLKKQTTAQGKNYLKSLSPEELKKAEDETYQELSLLA
ncbi:putative barnase/colicin E5 family endoribonuclease, partial [Helicobacter ailurogastricus]